MFTLQILDRGQTVLFPLAPGAAVLGSAPTADFRLHEEGVEPEHVRLEVEAERVQLTALAAVSINGKKINGSAVGDVELQLGDRIELGRAVAIVGQSVARPAEPEDVLDTPRSRTSRRAAAPPKRSKLPFVVVGGVIALLAAVGFLTSDGEGVIEGELSAIALARDKGDLDRARSFVTRLRAEWKDAGDDRLTRLEAEADKVEAVADYVTELEQQILDPETGTYAKWVRRLRGIEDSGGYRERLAARLVRSSLRETFERRPARPAGNAVADNEPSAGSTATESNRAGGSDPGASGTGDVDTGPAPEKPAVDVASVLADADRLAGQGLFAQAMALVRSQLGALDDAGSVTRLQDRLGQIEVAALAAMNELVDSAEKRAADGDHSAALTSLSLAQHKYPGSGPFARLPQALAAIEAAAEAARAPARRADGSPESMPKPGSPVASRSGQGDSGAGDGGSDGRGTPSETAGPTPNPGALTALRDELDRIRTAEANGAFARAAGLLRKASEQVRELDPNYADRLAQRAVDASQRAALHDSVVAALQAGRRLRVALHRGGEVELDAVADPGFRAGDRVVAWSDLSGAGVAALATAVDATGQAAIGAASLVYAAGDPRGAEKLLAGVLRADASQKPVIDRAVARGRGERLDGEGYVLRKQGFIAVRRIEIAKAADKIASKISSVARQKDPEVRRKFVKDLLEDGPDALEAVAMAFQSDLDEQVDKLANSTLRKQFDSLAAQRDLLDKARDHARELIYDEVKYFYPYKQPAVSSEKAAEYSRVQAEVNRRIAALRAIWRDKRISVRVPRSLRTAITRIDWASDVLKRLGAFDPRRVERVAWARAIPPVRSIGIAEFCKTRNERNELLQWQRIEEYNKVVGRELSSSVRELLRITNDYRAMYRHRPLAIVPVICTAAQGHAEEMSRLGYFAHMSPTPGRRTPFDRMKLAGYSYGVSENIALNGSALGAHNAWLGSSGHHRNLLNPQHREMGIGVDGRNWVENFGGGSLYKRDSAYRATETR